MENIENSEEMRDMEMREQEAPSNCDTSLNPDVPDSFKS